MQIDVAGCIMATKHIKTQILRICENYFTWQNEILQREVSKESSGGGN